MPAGAAGRPATFERGVPAGYRGGMALQSLQITSLTAMRARDVSRPSQEQQEAADRRPLRDETPRREQSRRGRDNNK
ncbi:hypothetical protein Psi01_46720 [Planobispora siamensis]|uniref:Uncharacterized protein n=2 Tax=Planobispora siamensis TaxID=936338 RepID=A0A8J3SGR3_9ACTN|nr:hypothetical protein Psi01_46720 [Planobispora siamensis]